MFQKGSHAHKREDDIINGAILTPEQAFGYQNVPIIKNAEFITDDTILYPTGRHLATMDLVNRRTDFIRREETFASSINALAVGMSRKKELVIAMGERMKNGVPRVLIYIPDRLRWYKLNLEQDGIP